MHEQDSSPTPLPGSKPKKPLDTVVKMALGVFVVGRLSGRHDIRVQLRRSSPRGITAEVMLPPNVVREHGDHMDPPGLTARHNSE